LDVAVPFDGHQHHQSREANLMGALALCGEALDRARALGVWPLAPEARASFCDHLRELAKSIDSYADQLEELWKRRNG
jgi:hypothetical protein